MKRVKEREAVCASLPTNRERKRSLCASYLGIPQGVYTHQGASQGCITGVIPTRVPPYGVTECYTHQGTSLRCNRVLYPPGCLPTVYNSGIYPTRVPPYGVQTGVYTYQGASLRVYRCTYPPGCLPTCVQGVHYPPGCLPTCIMVYYTTRVPPYVHTGYIPTRVPPYVPNSG